SVLFALLLALPSNVAWSQAAVVDRTIAERGGGYELSFAYPELGLSAIDPGIHDWVQSEVDGFKQAVAQRTPQEPPYSAQLRYIVACNDEAALAVLFKYSVYTGGAHGNLVQTSFNFLMPDAAQVFLPDLVGDDGVQRVS